MATKQLTGAPVRADHDRPAAPLPLPLVRAVTRYEAATARRDELTAKPASQWSPAEFDSFMAVHDAIVESVLTLGEKGRLDLIEPAETAARYRQASAHCRELSKACSEKLAYGGEFSDVYYALADARNEMGHHLCQLEAAGRLDLIGGA